jgi:hypothetical protein
MSGAIPLAVPGPTGPTPPVLSEDATPAATSERKATGDMIISLTSNINDASFRTVVVVVVVGAHDRANVNSTTKGMLRHSPNVMSAKRTRRRGSIMRMNESIKNRMGFDRLASLDAAQFSNNVERALEFASESPDKRKVINQSKDIQSVPAQQYYCCRHSLIV